MRSEMSPGHSWVCRSFESSTRDAVEFWSAILGGVN